MHIPLWEHQSKFNGECRELLRRGSKSILMQAATGFGKSRCMLEFAYSAHLKGNKSIVVTPRRELVNQMSQTFKEFNVPHTFVSAGKQYDPKVLCRIATTATLANRMENVQGAVLFVDEVHFGAGTLDRIIKHYKERGAIIIGYSATPERLDGRGLGCWFDDMVEGPSVQWLMDNKYLSDYRMFAPITPDLTGIKTLGGDYNKRQLASFMEHDRALLGNAIQHYKDQAMGRRNIVFCSSIKHSEIVAYNFQENGIPAAHIDGKTPELKRKKIIQAFAKGEIKVLTNVNLCTFGFDLSAAAGMDVTIDCMSDLRPTQSLALQMQKYGRVLRKKDHPALIFDHSGNAMRHGLPSTDRDWTLDDKPKAKRRKGELTEKEETVKQCPKCYYVHEPAPKCPSCKFEYPVQAKPIEEIDGTLNEIDKQAFEKAERDRKDRMKRQLWNAKTIEDLKVIAKEHGYKPGWVYIQAKHRKITS